MVHNSLSLKMLKFAIAGARLDVTDGCSVFAEALKSVKEQVNSNGKHPYPLIFFMESKWFDEPVALYVEKLKSRASFLSCRSAQRVREATFIRTAPS